MICECLLTEVADSVENGEGDGSSLPPTTNSPQTLCLAEQWITNCQNKHRKCNAAGDGNWYPTRLLDSGPLSSRFSTVSLVETAQTQLTGPYMTLSHRWGSGNYYKLTTSTRDQLLLGLPSSALPQTFQDAFFVARRLGIRYLWIDALCIIQHGDKQRDWQNEVTLMHKVYMNSHCNISAAHVPDSTHSMFSSRNLPLLQPQIVNVYLDGQEGLHLLLDAEQWHREVQSAPLNSRSWVLQERLLAPRILHFGDGQLFWECHEMDASETWPTGLPKSLFATLDTHVKNLEPDGHEIAAVLQSANGAGPEYTAHFLWWRIVRSYVRCDLTVESDKLLALSAIAKRMRPILQDEYVAGMWRRYLEAELLWSRSLSLGEKIRKTSRPEVYRAPSWSWASLDGALEPGMPFKPKFCYKVEHVELDHVTTDTTGAVRGGRLWLRGPLLRMTIQRDQWAVAGLEWHFEIDGQRPWSNNHIRPTARTDIDNEDFTINGENGRLFAMLAAYVKKQVHILIFQLLDAQRGVFRRVGHADYDDPDGNTFLIKPSPNSPCIEYRHGVHLIEVI